MTNRFTCANPKTYPVIKHERIEGEVRFTAQPIQQRLEAKVEVEAEPQSEIEPVPHKPKLVTLLTGIVESIAKV